MGNIYIKNNTSAAIHVRVTSTGGATERFFDINPGNTEDWGREDWQVAIVLRDDNDETETFVVKPGNSYTVPKGT